ncbi:hypothetical protein C8K30_102646 [Promicromonospora sp. AC04]|uniref:hypothetical protein n=1 Tax=Promicromonospora sp. AC04 TaxID=2135723 RepID=UPI000D3C7CF2|nr:hypothetical protein [Promicromonospora sp. AC04]PUB30264.1 hypothetical protein C8K30_102646 [Promicromonospora sp. AC04]
MVGTDSTEPAGIYLFLGPQYDVAWLGVVVVVLALMVTALAVWFRTRWDRLWEGLLVLVVIVGVPVLGPVLFLAAWGQRRARHQARAEPR